MNHSVALVPPLFFQQPCAETSGHRVPGPKVIHGSLLVNPSERHFVIRCNTGVQLTVLPNTMEKRTTWSPHRKDERGIHEVTLLDDER